MGNTPFLNFEDYKALVDQAPVMLWRADITMGCDYFNDRWLAFTGRPAEEQIGRGWSQCVHPADLNRCLQVYETAFNQRQAFEMEYRLRRNDGVYRWILDRGVPFWDEDGHFAGFIGGCIDVTERVEAKQALIETQKAEIDHLRRLMPICSKCHKVRNEAGIWAPIDLYLRDERHIHITHGICPECVEDLYSGPGSGLVT